MFEMNLPWWEFVARGAIVYIVLLILVRVSGRRTVGQFTPFDLLVVMLLSEGVSNALSGSDDSITGGLIIATTLIALNILFATLSSRSRKMADVIDGTPVLLARDGRIFEEVRKKVRLSEDDITQALHEADCSMEEVKYLFLEADGSIAVIRRKPRAD